MRPFLALAAGLMLIGCAASQAPTDERPLYERLGGKEGVDLIVDRFILNIMTNPELRPAFADTPIYALPNLKRKFAQQICDISDGPCAYKGLDMVAAHEGMDITLAQFNAMGREMQAALQRYRIDDRAQRELLTLMGRMQDDIVGQ